MNPSAKRQAWGLDRVYMFVNEDYNVALKSFTGSLSLKLWCVASQLPSIQISRGKRPISADIRRGEREKWRSISPQWQTLRIRFAPVEAK